jgi:hypothetical protein
MGAWLRLTGQVPGRLPGSDCKRAAEGERGRRIVIDCEGRGAVVGVGERAMLGS